MARREKTGLKFASALPLSAAEQAQDEPSAADRMHRYERARCILAMESIRRSIVADYRRYLTRPTQRQLAIARRIVGERSE